jgi:ATP-binding cassette subfamily B protein
MTTCYCRAFLKDAPIIILDESISNLDKPSEMQVFEALERLMIGRTTFIIAHRFSTVVQANRIVVVDHGRIVQEGTHVELLRSGNAGYSRLYQRHLSV